MSSYRLSLTIDAEFAKILNFFKASFPLLSDVEIIKMIIGEKYVEKKATQKANAKTNFQAWSESLPVLELTKEEEDSIEESIKSGSAGAWNSQQFLTEMMS